LSIFGKDLAGEEFIRIRQIVLDDCCPHLLVMQAATNYSILMIMIKTQSSVAEPKLLL
jgi:hypothetical protein